MRRLITTIMAAVLSCLPLAAEETPDEPATDYTDPNDSSGNVTNDPAPRDGQTTPTRTSRDGMIRYWWNTDDNARVAGILAGNDFAEVATSIVGDVAPTPDQITGNYGTIVNLIGANPDFPSENADGTAQTARPFTSAQMKSALTSYTGHSYSHALQAAHSNVRGMRQGILRHVDDINKTIGTYNPGSAKSSESALPTQVTPVLAPGTERRFWVGGVGQWEEFKDSDEGLPGYKYSSTGVLTGFDQTYGAVSIGGAFGYSGGKFKDRSALENDSRINSYSANVYATYNPGSNLRAMALAGYGYSDTSLRKYRAGAGENGETAEGWERSKYGVDTFSLGGKIGYETEYRDRLTLGVTGGVFYQHSRANNFTSTFAPDVGTGSSAISVGKLRTHSLSLPIDITADYLLYSTCESSLTLSANAGYGFEFNNDGASGTLTYSDLDSSARVDFTGRSPGRNSVNLGVGVSYENDRIDLTARHDVYLRSDYVNQRFTGNVGIKF